VFYVEREEVAQLWNGVLFNEKGFKKLEFINYRMSSFGIGDVVLNGKCVCRNRR
jgi:hypothetical protein